MLIYLFDHEIVDSGEKLNLHKTVILQYIKIPYISNKFNNTLKQHLSKNWSEVEFNFNTLTEYTLKINFIAVNRLILECNIFSTLEFEEIVNQKCILENVFKYVYNNGVIVNFESIKLSYFENLIEFLINLECGNDIITLLIMDKSYIINTSKYKHKLFSHKPITKYYLNNPDIFFIKLLTEYPLNDQTFYVILEVLKISNNKKKDDQAKLLIEKIVKSNQFCEQLKNTFSWNETFEFVELSSNVIDTFRNESMIFFQLWICEQLTDNNLSIYHKCRLLGFLPKLVSNQIYKESLDCTIRKCLIDLRDKHFSGPSSKLKPRSIDLTNLVTTFQKILTAMELSSSYLLFEVVVEWCIKDPNHLEAKHYLTLINISRLCDETQLQCCDFVYKNFRNEFISENRREMIISGVAYIWRTHVPIQACMIFLCCDDLNKAQLWCKLRIRNFLKEWEIISPQYYKLRADKLLNLQTLSEIYYFIKSSSNQSNDYTKIISRQIQIWESQLPIDSDSLLLWDTKILNRSIFLNKINADIDDLPSEEKCYLKQILNNYEIKSLLALIESAINKNNYYVAKKYMNEFRFENIENWKSDYILCRSKVLAMSSCYTIDAEKKIKCYLNSWSELGNIILSIKEQCTPICLLKTNFHIANISKNIAHILHKTSDINLLSKNVLLEIMSKIKSKIHFKHLSEVLQQIDCTIIQNLKNCILIVLNSNLCTETIVDSHLMLAQYCLEELNFKENTKDNQKFMIFIESVLKAMKYGSEKASELFPIILQFENLTDYSLKKYSFQKIKMFQNICSCNG
ncbi:hypothetical protein AGLY_005461 [Aphis glycines]|uniref:PIK-related kinase FAT domain-containing protein n=1 Tax=Aphis glycines TaxID=307491 RepID=A0A6G0TWD3_APHGL|nr:hypothetical protein AGLY_005461 [Aphis glycines]